MGLKNPNARNRAESRFVGLRRVVYIMNHQFARVFQMGAVSLILSAITLKAQQYQAVILPRPANFPYAYGEGTVPGRQAGWGIPENGNYEAAVRALLWKDAKPPLDITPEAYRAARIDDAEKVWRKVSGTPHANGKRQWALPAPVAKNAVVRNRGRVRAGSGDQFAVTQML